MASMLKNQFNKSAVPTEEDIQKAIAECDAEIEMLDEKVKVGKQLSDDLKAAQEAYERLKAAVFPKEEGVPPGDGWKKKSDVEKGIVYREVQAFGDRLEILNRGDVAVGRIVFIIAAAVLILSVVLYFWMHAANSDSTGGSQSSHRFAPERVIEMQKNMAGLQALAAEKITAKDSVREAFKAPFDSVKSFAIFYGGMLSANIFALVGKLENEIERGNVQPATVDSLGRAMTAQVQGLDTGFFWISEPGKWFEIAFWALWGTLVGILFYLTGRLSGELFDRHEIPEMVTEVIITPFAVIALFFLFSFTGITAFDPREGSIVETLGIAFILGFAIRRTVGLMDTIKRRLLPEPSPGG